MADRKGLWIALGSCGVLLFAGAVLIGIIVFTVIRHLEIRPMSTASAEQEYGLLRDRFAGQVPLLEIDGDNPERVQVRRHSERSGPPGDITALHIFVWNPRDRKVVKLALPVWLLRFQVHSGPVHWKWRGDELNLENVNLTIEDLEYHGPGLILDFEGRRGEHVLIWSE